MNAFAPRYDPATGRAVMYPHPDGAWVHVGDALEMKEEIERLKAVLRLLWEEAQDKCAIRDDTTEAVEAALKEVE